MRATEIDSETEGDVTEIRVAGPLDNDGALRLSAAIDAALRLGGHSIAVDLQATDYISSAGVGALVKAHKQLKAIRGDFAVVATSPQVASVIRLSRLTDMLVRERGQRKPPTESAATTFQTEFRLSLGGEMTYEVYDLPAPKPLECEILGTPASFPRGTFPAPECRPVEFPTSAMGLGLGAFGSGHDACADRFGEFLAAGGAAFHQTPGGAGRPDFQRVLEDYVPTVQTLYGLRCVGDFPRLVRFERADDDVRLPLSFLADQFLSLSEGTLAAMVLLADTSGLVGARLRRSPTAAPSEPSRFSHPEIRRWLSFTPDHAYPHSLALVAGVVSRGEPRGAALPLAPFLRPLAPGSSLLGHFHAVTFSYRPFKKRRLDLQESVAALCETEDLLAVLHLLHDDREITGGGESGFVRGACWVGAMSGVRGGGL